MTQAKDDLDLNSLVDFLTTRGSKASTATIERLTKASAAIASASIAMLKNDSATVDAIFKTQKITDADRRGMLYVRQAGILAATVEELKTWLGLLDLLYHPKTLDDRLRVLFEFAASIAVLARRCIDDELADQLLKREQKCLDAVNAGKEKSAKLQPRNKLIFEVAKEIRFMDPKQLPWGVAGKVLENKQLTESKEWKAKPLKQGGVNAIVTKHWARLSPSLPKRTSRR
jgi:hypothetical protein